MPPSTLRGLAATLGLCCAQAFAHAAPTALQRAQLDAHERHRLGVGVLVLARGDESAELAALMHSRGARYALRSFDLVVLRPRADGRYRVERLRGECDGIEPCAQEEFLHGLDAGEARALAQGHLGHPMFVVYSANGDPRPCGIAFGFDDLDTIVRFARAVRQGSPGQPALFEDRQLLSRNP
ncbi:MAG: hypothetical protein KGJ03_05975 [Betaproteobacteria bacterium]|nr:hypothetical protein [Betaproteobacteria bacterium]MBU6511626.1 hypothetical protein [Betaproteobacteria bacterium]MDE1955248.1 hypothetical protein [Betaproteobacteria bacterium]